jgi:hypothetical protein
MLAGLPALTQEALTVLVLGLALGLCVVSGAQDLKAGAGLSAALEWGLGAAIAGVFAYVGLGNPVRLVGALLLGVAFAISVGTICLRHFKDIGHH